MTFVATLAFAPHIQTGILAGITFSLGAFIYRRMLPRISVVALGDDGALHEMLPGQPPRAGGELVVALRYDAALFFANASFFEDAVNRLELENPRLQAIVVLAQGINLVDATALEVLRALNLETAVGRARVGHHGVRWQGATTTRARRPLGRATRPACARGAQSGV